ncbi:MAG: RagB/SusD family nutrient uptake outer membrane protein [Bacteroidales bacterium]|nr:RagB/SusD family nutrient uptake outer membrane protein [Bacteroidales bacterium]
MKNNMKNIAFILLAVLLFTACKEQLDISPKSNLEMSNFFNTEEDFGLALVGCYDAIAVHEDGRAYGTYFKGLLNMGIVGTDEMYVVDGFWDNEIEILSQYTYTAFASVPYYVYVMQYRGISRCNTIIGALKSTEVEMSASTKDRMLGEAHFLRAFYYFQLVRFYGGVPIITEETNLNEFRNIRSTLAETYDRIISDFRTADEYLPIVNTPGRATKYAAKSFLAKAYLQMAGEPLNDPAAAAMAVQYASEVVNNGPYDLEPIYGDIFHLDNEHGIEYIFSAEYIGTDNEGGEVATWSGVPGPWENTLAYLITRAMPELAESYQPGDIRKARNAVDYGIGDAQGTIVPRTDGVWWAWKWRHNPDPNQRDYGREWQSPYNHPLTRFADVLLTYAEALWREAGSPASFSDANALEAINRVRRRGYGLDQHTAAPAVDFTSITEQALLDERKWELCFEGHRWHDLNRFGKLVEVVRACATGNPTAAANIKDHHTLFPIPAKEIQVSNGDLKQNPGYSSE